MKGLSASAWVTLPLFAFNPTEVRCISDSDAAWHSRDDWPCAATATVALLDEVAGAGALELVVDDVVEDAAVVVVDAAGAAGAGA